MTTGDIALQQIRDKQYAQPFLGSGKTIILLGIAFDQAQRNIADWQQETLRLVKGNPMIKLLSPQRRQPRRLAH